MSSQEVTSCLPAASGAREWRGGFLWCSYNWFKKSNRVTASKFLSMPPFPTDKLQDQGSAWKLADTVAPMDASRTRQLESGP